MTKYNNNNNGNGKHIVSSYDKELNQLKSYINDMTTLSIRQIEKAINAIENDDKELAKQIIESDQEIDDIEHKIEELAIRILALRHPVALDLRNVVATMKIATDIERIADYATNISKRLIKIKINIPDDIKQLLDKMGKVVCKQLDDVVKAFYANDSKLAKTIWLSDDEVDNYHDEIMEKVLNNYIKNNSDDIDVAEYTRILFMAKNLERAGDHITNIAEMVFFRAKGKVFDSQKL